MLCGDNRGLRFAPYHTFYPRLGAHLALVGMGPVGGGGAGGGGGRYAGNRWHRVLDMGSIHAHVSRVFRRFPQRLFSSL